METDVNCLVRKGLRVSEGEVQGFEKNGFVRLSQVLDGKKVTDLGARLKAVAIQHAGEIKPLDERGYKDKAFIQVSGLWKKEPALKDYIRESGLADLAAQAMGCEKVRLQGDHVLVKDAGGEGTPWHSDYFYIPLETRKVCAVWIPFRDLKIHEGALGFIKGSHRIMEGSDYMINEEGARKVQEIIDERALEEDFSDYALGDCSIHYASTFHGTRKNTGSESRTILTIFFADASSRVVKEPRNEFQAQHSKGFGEFPNEEDFPVMD